jgi:hypothetical protein
MNPPEEENQPEDLMPDEEVDDKRPDAAAA